MKPVLSFLKDILTTKDGESFDNIRVGLIVAVLATVGFTGWDVIANRQHFNAVEFATGLGALFAGGGLGINLKAKDEPDV